MNANEAVELLGLSRPFVVRLLDEGEIPSERPPRSRHRRVLLSDVLAFQAQREQRRTGRQRVSQVIDEAGLPCDLTTRREEQCPIAPRGQRG